MAVRTHVTGLCGSVSIALAFVVACTPPTAAQTLLNSDRSERGGAPLPGVLRGGNFDAEDLAPQPASSLPEDGDLSEADTSQDLRDGIYASADEADAAVIDGIDPATSDQRPPSERNEFAYPTDPGPVTDSDNPLLFQVEEIEPFDPAQNRRPTRFASLDPYDPIGVRIGTFIFFPELEIAAARFSNVFTSQNAESDIAGELRPNLRLVSNWSNHALEFQATGDLSNYRKFGSENDRGFSVESRGRLDVTRRTNLQADIRRQRSQESRSAIDARSAGARASVISNEASVAANHRFNRLSIQLRGALTDANYTPTTTFDPITGNPAGTLRDRDETERRAAIRASWEFRPTFNIFAEVEGNKRSFETASSADNRRRDSEGSRVRAGISFGETGEIWRGEVSLGGGVQDLDDSRLADVRGLLVDANLAWRLSGLTSLLFTASSDISSVTQTTNTGAAFERRGGIEARHAFRNYLIGSTGLQVAHRDYAGIDVEEREFVYSLGLEYFMSREATAFARYEHTAFRSDFDASDYDSDEVRVGLRLRR